MTKRKDRILMHDILLNKNSYELDNSIYFVSKTEYWNGKETK